MYDESKEKDEEEKTVALTTCTANKRGAKTFHDEYWRMTHKNIRLEECCGIFLLYGAKRRLKRGE